MSPSGVREFAPPLAYRDLVVDADELRAPILVVAHRTAATPKLLERVRSVRSTRPALVRGVAPVLDPGDRGGREGD